MRVDLAYADTPPSYNTFMHAHWRTVRNHKQVWQLLFENLLTASPLRRLQPGESRFIYAEGILTFPLRRRRDEGNFRVVLEKALGDALTNGRWLADDTTEFYRFGKLLIEEEPGPARTLICLTVEGDIARAS